MLISVMYSLCNHSEGDFLTSPLRKLTSVFGSLPLPWRAYLSQRHAYLAGEFKTTPLREFTSVFGAYPCLNSPAPDAH